MLKIELIEARSAQLCARQIHSAKAAGPLPIRRLSGIPFFDPFGSTAQFSQHFLAKRRLACLLGSDLLLERVFGGNFDAERLAPGGNGELLEFLSPYLRLR